jgi:hypothetical protein
MNLANGTQAYFHRQKATVSLLPNAAYRQLVWKEEKQLFGGSGRRVPVKLTSIMIARRMNQERVCLSLKLPASQDKKKRKYPKREVGEGAYPSYPCSRAPSPNAHLLSQLDSEILATLVESVLTFLERSAGEKTRLRSLNCGGLGERF